MLEVIFLCPTYRKSIGAALPLTACPIRALSLAGRAGNCTKKAEACTTGTKST